MNAPVGIDDAERLQLIKLSHTEPSASVWQPYLTALEKAIDWDDQQYPAGILNTLLLLNKGKEPF